MIDPNTHVKVAEERDNLIVESVALKHQNSKLRDALGMLYDAQNGPPLVREEAFWNRAMEMAKAALQPGAGSLERTLPSVAGRMEMTHETFQRACQVALGELQENPNCDTHLVRIICEAVRCSRECCELAKRGIGTFTKEEVMPLVEALREIEEGLHNVDKDDGHCLNDCPACRAQLALNHARKIGLLT